MKTECEPCSSCSKPIVHYSNLCFGCRNVAGIKKKWKFASASMAVMKGLPEKPLEKAKITLTRHSSKEPDFDGLVVGFKPVIDGLKDAGVIKDDKPSVIGQPTYLWKKAKMREGKITVKVEQI